MRNTFAHKFNLEQRQQQQVSRKWHYTTSPFNSQSPKTVTEVQKEVSVNKNIRPLKIEGNKPVVSAQHEKLIKEIAEIEHLKKMQKKAERANQAEFNVIKLMNERVKQYNYLVEHKHIKEKNSEDTKRVLKLKPKSQAQLIVQQIKTKNKQLLQAEDINKQFELNKTIAALYRKYKDKMYEETKHGGSTQKITTGSLCKQKSIKKGIDGKSQISRQRTRNYSECISKLKLKLEDHTSREDNSQNDDNLGESVNIDEPYMTKEEIKINNEFQNFTENRKEMLKMYRFKITKLKNHGHERKHSKRKSVMPSSETKIELNRSLFQSLEKDSNSEEPDRNLISELKKKRETQLQYFTTFLDKRNRKYKKPWGNKILIQFKSLPLAKQMLQGAFASTQKIEPNPNHLGLSLSRKTKMSTSMRLGQHVSEEDRMIFQSMEKDKNDPQLYETMCKNEKVNLFLKAKKKGKD